MIYSGSFSHAGITRTWRSPACIAVLVDQLDAAFPGRSHGAEGTIGDATHAAEGFPTFDGVTGRATGGTDHLPDALNLVCAVDIDANGCDVMTVAHAIALSHDSRVAYMELENVVPGRKIECSRFNGFRFVDVGHSSAGPHLHVSVLHKLPLVDGRQAWTITNKPVPVPTPAPKSEEDDTMVPLDDGATHQSPALPVAWAEGNQVLAAHTAQSPFAAGGVKFGAAWVLDLGHPIKRVAAAPSKRGLWVLFDDLTTTGVVFTSAVSVA